MQNYYETIQSIASSDWTGAPQQRMLNDFAEAFGWRPSESFYASEVSDIASAHILVEHGLENTAVLTFLRSPRSYSELNLIERERLLAISYNNLVDWHIPIGIREVCTVYNRVRQVGDAGIVSLKRLTSQSLESLRSEIFEQLTGKRPNPNVPALDDALINTISKWRRILSAELEGAVSIEELSALFNAIIFARAVEDHAIRLNAKHDAVAGSGLGRGRMLVKLWDERKNKNIKLKDIIYETITQFTGESSIPQYLVDEKRIKRFNSIASDSIRGLLSEFYKSPNVPYQYDFSVMSKHALSRVYEHYVSLLRYVEKPQNRQLSMFGDSALPEEVKSKAYGSVYTPQFIARFFAKYIREKLPRSAFLKAKAADPACGSGIFLRTLLELRFDSNTNDLTTDFVQDSVNQVLGVDIDFNAAQATRLSLALLSLALTGKFPKTLNIESAEGVEFYLRNASLKESQDAVLANPPFVALDAQPEAIRERIATFMSGFASGRIDTYLAFLKIGFELLKPGGIGLYVLPHSFLLSESGRQMRRFLAEHCWILCLADLSAIRVFGDTLSYAILLVFQKKTSAITEEPTAVIAKCQDMVGRALQDVLDNKYSENETYSVYPTGQGTFNYDRWIILPPTEAELLAKFEQLPTLDDFLQVRQGFASGADDVFIVSPQQLELLEDKIFVPHLPDREMLPYGVPRKTDKFFFFPYVKGKYITEGDLKKMFPKTWNYLRSNSEQLRQRSPVKRGDLEWWKPVRPRSPEEMMRPKIVTPHLVFVPRFSVDTNGKYAVSHSPFLYPRAKNQKLEKEFLLYFVAVLNSQACYWYIASHSHVYQRNYTMLEVKTLNKTPVPDPQTVEPKVMS